MLLKILSSSIKITRILRFYEVFYDKIRGMDTSTTRSITYNGDIIEYELTIKRVKNMNMRITKDGVIHVSANGYVPDYRVGPVCHREYSPSLSRLVTRCIECQARRCIAVCEWWTYQFLVFPLRCA